MLESTMPVLSHGHGMPHACTPKSPPHIHGLTHVGAHTYVNTCTHVRNRSPATWMQQQTHALVLVINAQPTADVQVLQLETLRVDPLQDVAHDDGCIPVCVCVCVCVCVHVCSCARVHVYLHHAWVACNLKCCEDEPMLLSNCNNSERLRLLTPSSWVRNSVTVFAYYEYDCIEILVFQSGSAYSNKEVKVPKFRPFCTKIDKINGVLGTKSY